jgi:alanyl-tRNA synthetase
MTERLYYTDAYRFSFDAKVLCARRGPEGWETVIDRTCFYPGGGGQPPDRGTLAGRVLVAIEERGDEVVHVLDGEPSGTEVHGELDAARRLDFMVQHTAEHLLSQCLLAAGNLPTVSVHFGDETATIEVTAEEVPGTVLAEAERRANAIARENRKVSTREVDRETALGLPLRRRPPEGDRLRIVQIDGCDMAACGGVHVASTGHVAPVKISGVERIRGRTRIHFLAGERAVTDYGRRLALSQALSRLLTCGEGDIVKRVGDLAENERGLSRELKRLRVAEAVRAAAEAAAGGRLLPEGPDGGPRLFVSRVFDGFGEEPLKAFVEAVLSTPGRVVAAADRSTDGFRWTVAHSLGAGGGDLASLLKPVIAALGLRGGGRQALVQGAGPDPSAAEAFVEAAARAFSA